MKGGFILICAVMLCGFVVLKPSKPLALKYYFSNSIGNDSYTSTQAQNPATPWKTLAKLSAWRASGAGAGDSLLLKRGDIWREQLRIIAGVNGTSNGIGAYGTGAKPTISGMLPLSTWSSLGGNKWEATVPGGASTVGVLSVNGVYQAMGRWPNKGTTNDGWNTYTGWSGAGQISGTGLSGTPNYTGYTLVVRKRQYIIDKGIITSQSGGTLNFNPTDGSGWVPDTGGFGWFLQNSFDLLDAEGEWYYNNSPSRVDLYSATNPSSQNVQVSVFDTLVRVYAQNNLTFNNIRFEGSNMATFSMENSNNCSVIDCEIDMNGADAVRNYVCEDATWLRNSITNTGNNAFTAEAATRVNFSYNIVRAAGVWLGMGRSNGAAYEGVYFSGSSTGGNVIYRNIIDSIGYNGVHFGGNNYLISENFINNFNRTMSDGAAIYSSFAGYYESGRIVRKNIITNGVGYYYGTNNAFLNASSGVYFDDKSSGGTIDSNFISTVSENGIYIHNAKNFNIFDNTVYNARQAQMWFAHDVLEPSDPIRGLQVRRNFLFAKSGQAILRYSSTENDLAQIGAMDYNYYSRPSSDGTAMMYVTQLSGSTNYTFDQWKSSFYDNNSGKTPAGIIHADSIYVDFNATSTPKPVNFGNLDYVNLRGQGYSGAINVNPYTGILVIRKTLDRAVFTGGKFIFLP